MSVVGYGRNYREEYLKIDLNNGTKIITFDNWEIVKDVEFGETHYPEIHKSALGYASKVSARIPMKMKVTFRLAYPKTVGKLNDILAYTRDRYNMRVFLYGFSQWPAASPAWVHPNSFDMDAVIEFPNDLVWRQIARGEGFNRETEPEIIFWESASLKLPTQNENSGIFTLPGDGVTSNVVTKIPVILTQSGTPKTN